MKNNNTEICQHENIVWGSRWLGIFPKTQYGVCKDCGKQMVRVDGEIKEKEVKVDK